MANRTPLMEQYWGIKSQYPDAILFFRLGDFYETFFEDAQVAARELGLTLTSRTKDTEEPVPLAGVPYHSYQGYAAKLVRRGFKVAICEQMGDPKLAKGLVERKVVRVLTPGTITDGDLLDAGTHNFLLAVAADKRRWALAYCDLSTGDASITRADGDDAPARILQETLKVGPTEVLAIKGDGAPELAARARDALGLPEGSLTLVDRAAARRAKVAPTGAVDAVMGEPESALALAGLSGYVESRHGSVRACFEKLRCYRLDEACLLDPGTVRNLELFESMREHSRRGSLLGVLDRTRTPMGARLLRRWLAYPLLGAPAIEARQDAVEALVRLGARARSLGEDLGKVYDIPRILAKVSAGTANPRDLKALGTSLGVLGPIRRQLSEAGLVRHAGQIHELPDLAGLLDRALVDTPPTTTTEGQIFREGFSRELDELNLARTDAQTLIARLEESERERTGIKSLKVRYNRMIGYFIEVTKANLEHVPVDFVRRQGMASGERFTTGPLKEMESRILSAQEQSRGLEQAMFSELREQVAAHVESMQETARTLAEADVLLALSTVAIEGQWTRPRLVAGTRITIEQGRHPVVEQFLPGGAFVPNDLSMSPESGQIAILTGPNMGGKSTYLRQAAVLTVMAQMGSFVPARRMELAPVDKIFTRVGASDDLASAQSTFMVEMRETAFILQNATSQSLVILDEVGRGTSTFDGLCLAWAIVEHLVQTPTLRPKTLFATHYHELTQLAQLFPGVMNLSTKVVERGDDVVFLHKVVEGPADKSYGVHVAKLAGIPKEVLARARELLVDLEQVEEQDVEQKRRRLKTRPGDREPGQVALFDPAVHPVIEELRRASVETLTPLEALSFLARLKERI